MKTPSGRRLARDGDPQGLITVEGRISETPRDDGGLNIYPMAVTFVHVAALRLSADTRRRLIQAMLDALHEMYAAHAAIASDLKLCYVEGGFAYFTTQSLDRQWGDDWNDAPYESNAGTPYTYRADAIPPPTETPWKVYRCRMAGPLVTPSYGSPNSQFSIEQINRQAIAWLRTPPESRQSVHIHIWAGVSYEEFRETMIEQGGIVGELEDISASLNLCVYLCSSVVKKRGFRCRRKFKSA